LEGTSPPMQGLVRHAKAGVVDHSATKSPPKAVMLRAEGP
jgi:hypothetical protein